MGQGARGNFLDWPKAMEPAQEVFRVICYEQLLKMG